MRYLSQTKPIIFLIVFIFITTIYAPVSEIALAESEPVSISMVADYGSFLDPEFLYTDILITAGTEATNAVSIDLDFPADKLSLSEVDRSQSLCSITAYENIDNNRGNYRLICGGADAANGNYLAARLKFFKVDSGWAKLSFGDNTRVLANDGLGTSRPVLAEVHRMFIVK